VILVFAFEAVTVERVEGFAERRNVGAKKTELGRGLAGRADHSFAGAAFYVETLNAAKAKACDSIKVYTLGGDSNAD
jgi:hypothetical protein